MRQLAAALMLTLLAPTGAFAGGADGAWEHLETDDGISVHVREVEGSDVVAFRGVTTVDAPLGKILSVLANSDRCPEWVHGCSKSVVLEKVSNFEFVVYQEFPMPVIISDRDLVFRGRATRAPSGTVTVQLASVEHPKAPETIGVRSDLRYGSYVLVPLGPDRTRVIAEIQIDPMGMVPSFLVNRVQRRWPRKTLEGIRREVQRKGLPLYPLPPVTPPEVAKKAG